MVHGFGQADQGAAGCSAPPLVSPSIATVPEHDGPDSSALLVDPLISDLMRSMKTGTLRGSQVAGRLLECVQSLVPFRVTIGYDF